VGFCDSDGGNSLSELEYCLDRVTPLYKHRIDELPPAQQSVIDALAIGWDPMSAGQVAEKLSQPSRVSTQLSRLCKSGVAHSIQTGTKNNLYQLTERFFNIWYLMRCGSRRDRHRVIWFVRFLQPELSDSRGDLGQPTPYIGSELEDTVDEINNMATTIQLLNEQLPQYSEENPELNKWLCIFHQIIEAFDMARFKGEVND